MRLAVVGAGVIGLSVAWKCARAGIEVTVIDPAAGAGASYAAAGMLSPIFEARPGEEPLLALNRASFDRWERFASDLGSSTGIDLEFQQLGSLAVAFSGDDLRMLDDLCNFQRHLGLGVTRLRSGECRELEPALSPSVRGGIEVITEGAVDPRQVCRALVAAVASEGGRLVEERVVRLHRRGDRTDGVVSESGEVMEADAVVLATGACAAVQPEAGDMPIRPVKGQILRLGFDPEAPPLARNLHAHCRGNTVYMVPRASGELVIGATVEERGYDTSVTAGGLRQLLDAATDAVPAVAELEHVEAVARLRPATPDNAPIIGPSSTPGLILATGHYRNGVLLAPITAEAVLGLVTSGKQLGEVAGFGPERFS